MPKLRLCTSSLPPPPSNSPSVLAYSVPKFPFPTHSPTMSRLWVLLSSSFPFNFPLLPLLCRLFHCWVDSTLNSIPTTNMWRGSLVPNSVDNVLHAFPFFRPFRRFGDIHWHIEDAILGVIMRQWYGLESRYYICLSVRFCECQFRFLIQRYDYIIHYTWNLCGICSVHTDELEENKIKKALNTHYIIHWRLNDCL